MDSPSITTATKGYNWVRTCGCMSYFPFGGTPEVGVLNSNLAKRQIESYRHDERV